MMEELEVKIADTNYICPFLKKNCIGDKCMFFKEVRRNNGWGHAWLENDCVFSLRG